MIAAAKNRTFEIGSLVHARGRDWVVLGSDDPIITLRPLGGTEREATGIHRGLESVVAAIFELPSPHDIGDSASALLLRDAVRLTFRAGAGPFRSFGRIAVEPRSYQLVPLLMALRLDPVRLLIADDVGIGKTIEAGLIAREMLDRGEIDRLAVVCPPHLCEQWRQELAEKFHIEAVVVRPGTVSALERGLGNASLFQEYPFTVVSVDYIKSDKRRASFIQHCPEFVIVDEAHTAAAGPLRCNQQRHRLLRDLVGPATAAGRGRHLVMTTATPHSGVEEAFRSLLTLLDPLFAGLPDDPDEITATHPLRLKLGEHLVQRRRADIRKYLDHTTRFPEREVREETYRMSREYAAFFERAQAYAADMIRDAAGQSRVRQRVSWWAALALMQSVTSSPEAAVAALGKKSETLAALAQDDGTDESAIARVDATGDWAVHGGDSLETEEANDVVPGADITDDAAAGTPERRRLRELTAQAAALTGSKDAKLQALERQLKALLADGFSPIVYCRYIATANYLKRELGGRFRGTTVDAVTGDLPSEERLARVEALGDHPSRVLIATDCLSEGVNLQGHFDAVVHYDLSWNPTRHEQREGRVDRFGQHRPVVRMVMLSGEDNPIDLAVMRVLLRKAESIRRTLGVSVSVPQGTGAVMNAIFDAIFHGKGEGRQLTLDVGEAERDLDLEWRRIEEKASRTIFQQGSIHPELVRNELEAANRSLGNHADVERLVRLMVSRCGASLTPKGDHLLLPTSSMPGQVRYEIDRDKPLPIGFELPLPEGVTHLSRTHPLTEAICTFLIDDALEPAAGIVAKRASVIRSADVPARTTLALLRLRIHLRTAVRGGADRTLLAEEVLLTGWRGSGDALTWLTDDEVEETLAATPSANLDPGTQRAALETAAADFRNGAAAIARLARQKADEVLAAHTRVRDAARLTGGRIVAEPVLPVDALGLFVYLPVPRIG